MILSGGQAIDFAPQALGETVPQLANGWYYPNDGLTLSGKFATYAALYRAQPSIATLVDKISNAAARLTLKVWDTTPASGKVADEASGYARLLAQPSTFMSPYNFWRWTISTYEVYGEAFWVKQRNADGVVVSLIPMHPSKVSIKRNTEGETVYVFTVGVGSTGLLTLPASEVVPFQRYNPDSLMRGMSRLEPLRSTLLNEDASRRATASWWQRGARPAVVLKHPGELSEPAQQRLRANWESRHAGADMMGGTAILEEGMDAQVIQLSAEEMQYVESRKMNLQEVCMVFDVPPPVVHILDHATFSNITEQMRSMYRDTMAPRLEDVESVLDFYLRSEFFSAATHSAKFSLDEVLRGDFETRATAVGNLIEKGVYKPSEARPLFDLPEAGPEADRLYGNAALVPLGSSVHGQTEVNPAGDLVPSVAPMGAPKPITPPPASLSFRSLMGRVGSVKAAGGDVRAALVDEHRKALVDVFDRQRADAKAGRLGGAEWDNQLASVLEDLATATAKALGTKVAKGLGGGYDGGEIADWIHQNAVDSAKAINATTVSAVQDALSAAGLTKAPTATTDVVDAVFDGSVSARAAAIASSRVASVGGLAELNAAGQNGAASKTWNAGPKARSSHAAMNGETVPIGQRFSNGMNAPGDPAGGADEVAGCNCTLSFTSSGNNPQRASRFDPESLQSALDPARRRTASAVKAELEKTDAGKDLLTVIKRFTETRGGVASLRKNIAAVLDGTASDAVKSQTMAFLDALNTYPGEAIPALFRGFAVKVEENTNAWWDAFEAQFQPGQKITMNASSFTSSEKKAAEFQSMIGGTRRAGSNHTAVRFVMEAGDGRALPVEQLSKFKSEKEWISGGDFEVVDYLPATPKQPYYRVVIRQIKSLEAPK